MKAHVCEKFALKPFIGKREVSCQDCGKVSEHLSKLADMAYLWGAQDGAAEARYTIRRALGVWSSRGRP